MINVRYLLTNIPAFYTLYMLDEFGGFCVFEAYLYLSHTVMLKTALLMKPNLKCFSYIPLTNRVRGPYRKLRTEFFSPRFMAQARSAGHKSKGNKRGSVTYSTDRENEVSKIFIISLVCV